MSLKDEIRKDVANIFLNTWTERDGKVIPDDNSLKLGNDGINIEAAVLYADLAGSTNIVKKFTNTTAAEIYKTFLLSTCKVIRANGGEITAFDGDRVMAVFMGGTPNTTAAKTALQINYTVKQIVQPEFKKVYDDSEYKFEFGIGIDTSKILVAKTGIRGANDLVWVGNAANIAAKLCSIRGTDKTTWISENSYSKLMDSSKYGGPEPKRNMWTSEYNAELGIYMYGSSWWWEIK